MAYIYLFLAFTFNAFANILLKIGSSSGFDKTSFSPIVFFERNWHFIVGCFLFGLNAVFYFLALKNLAISVAYPIMVVMSFVIINIYAIFVLKESVNALQIAGYGFLVFGLVLIVANSR